MKRTQSWLHGREPYLYEFDGSPSAVDQDGWRGHSHLVDASQLSDIIDSTIWPVGSLFVSLQR